MKTLLTYTKGLNININVVVDRRHAIQSQPAVEQHMTDLYVYNDERER